MVLLSPYGPAKAMEAMPSPKLLVVLDEASLRGFVERLPFEPSRRASALPQTDG